jgi:hypothetical protein
MLIRRNILKDSERNIEEAPTAILPADTWERLSGESPKAYAAFCPIG